MTKYYTCPKLKHFLVTNVAWNEVIVLKKVEKTVENQEMLATSIFSFPHKVLKIFLTLGHNNMGLLSKWLMLSLSKTSGKMVGGKLRMKKARKAMCHQPTFKYDFFTFSSVFTFSNV